MSRHRNVRSLNVTEEREGYEYDIYGHSVEDDYCISPSDAGFIYDRSREQQMSAFLNKENDIQEEDEDKEDLEIFRKPQLSDFDEARLRSCLEEIHNIIGDSVPQNVLEETILKSNFDVSVSLDKILAENSSPKKTSTKDIPKSHWETRDQLADRGELESKSNVIKIIPPPSINIVKGFDVTLKDSDVVKSNSRCQSPAGSRIASPKCQSPAGSRIASPRCQSPAGSGRMTPTMDLEDVDKRIKDGGALSSAKTPARVRENKVDAEAQYKLDRGSAKENLNMVVIGHVDAGKSTLMGHLLYDLGQVNKRTMHKYEQDSKKMGKQSFLYAWILDETGEERSRGITMDVGQSKFETNTKMITLLDAPGHKDFIPNMITGATQADVAVLVLDSTTGEFETGFDSGGQTREHALLVRSLGVSNLAVAVNKLDTVLWSKSRFDDICQKVGQFLKQVGFRDSDVTYVPCSGLAGENLVHKPTEPALLEWYDGPTLLDVIDNFKVPERPISKPFRLSINDIYKGSGSGYCIAGRVETGMVQVGDKTLVMPQNEVALVKGITLDDVPLQTAYAGDQISVTLANYDTQNVNVGYLLCDPSYPVPRTTKFEARVVVFNISVPITQGYPIILHIQSLSEQAVITKLVSQLHKSTGAVIKRKPRCLVKNSNAVVVIETSKPICIELYHNIKELGRFMLRVGGVSVAAGLVTKIF